MFTRCVFEVDWGYSLVWWGTESFIRFTSEELGAADTERLGVSMGGQWLYARYRRRRGQPSALMSDIARSKQAQANLLGTY